MESSTSISKQHKRDWLELPSDVTANILFRIGMFDILENAQKVCTAWRKICLDPAMWRVIDITDLFNSNKRQFSVKEMCKHAVDRSQGELVKITLLRPYEISVLLPYVADRSRQLRCIELACYSPCLRINWTNVWMKFPLLEELSLYSLIVSKEGIETVSRCCPMLKTLKVNQEAFIYWGSQESLTSYDNKIAIAIGENLPELKHLELIGKNISNIGLQVILDHCCHLETLDLRKCHYINLNGDLGKRCFRQIKHLKLPKDSVEDCPYIYKIDTCMSNDVAYY